jgi:hypothetical protein
VHAHELEIALLLLNNEVLENNIGTIAKLTSMVETLRG